MGLILFGVLFNLFSNIFRGAFSTGEQLILVETISFMFLNIFTLFSDRLHSTASPVPSNDYISPQNFIHFQYLAIFVISGIIFCYFVTLPLCLYLRHSTSSYNFLYYSLFYFLSAVSVLFIDYLYFYIFSYEPLSW